MPFSWSCVRRRRRRSVAVLIVALPLCLAAACGGGVKPSTPEPRVIVSLPSPSATNAGPTQPPPTGGAPAPSATAFSPSSATSAAATAAAGVAPTTAGATVVGATPAPAIVAPSAASIAPPSDTALQAALARALVREGDLPSGFTASYLGQTDAALPNQTAGYGGFFANGDPTNPGPGGFQVFIAALAGFTDPASAQAQAADVRASTVASLGQGVTLQPIESRTTVAGAQLYQVQAPNNSSGQLSGYVVAWQHGRVLALLAQLGVPAPASPDTINAVARRQDQKLTAAGQ